MVFFTSLLCLTTLIQISTAFPLPGFRNRHAIREIQPSLACNENYCIGTADNGTLYDKYICGDYRLGPVDLPTHLPLSTLFETYDRFGGLCPGEYLSTWTDINGNYVYPEQEGFLLNTASNAIKGNVTLKVGTYVDRFGADTGYFLAPAASPYIQRALPPMNLNTAIGDTRYPANYHVYVVVSPVIDSKIGDGAFDVAAGPIASWFSQAGGGVQYKTFDSITTLIANGYLRKVHRAEY